MFYSFCYFCLCIELYKACWPFWSYLSTFSSSVVVLLDAIGDFNVVMASHELLGLAYCCISCAEFAVAVKNAGILLIDTKRSLST